MWLPRVDDAGPVAGFAGAALLFATVAHWLSSPESEMYSEMVCWAVLPVVIRSLNKPQPNRSLSRPVVAGKSRTTSSTTAMLWGYAANIAIYTFFKTEAGLIQFIVRLIHEDL